MRLPILDFWFDFASTYSYPAAMRIQRLANENGVEVRFRPFLLGPIFKTQGWATSPFNLFEAKGRNMWRDLERICADSGLPFRRPEPFPQNSVLAARVALIGLSQPWGEAFCVEAFRAQFSDGRSIETGETITAILAGLDVPAEPTLSAAQSNGNKLRLRDQTEQAQRAGIFGAPTFISADGELFWGNDRLERALLWATQKS
jgi:2-hydroxychromene-2-carboxylate isomerase